MKLNFDKTGPILMADLNVLGAAVRIIMAGGSDLSETEMKRVSGATHYLWQAKGGSIVELVRALETAPEPSAR